MAASSGVTRVVRAGRVALLAGIALWVWGPTAGAGGKPPKEWDGLERRESKSLANLYVRPGVEFKAYTSVRLDPVEVKMDKRWDPNQGRGAGLQGRLSSDDVRRIREALAKTFRDVFAERLAKGGYALVDADGEDVLVVQAALVDVYASAPDNGMAAAGSRSFSMDAGRMTLVMQLVDSVSGQTLARVVDTKQGTNTGRLQLSGSNVSSAEAQRAMGDWADALRKALDQVNGKVKVN